jgi:23S rRNA pseudouridine2457 synthase
MLIAFHKPYGVISQFTPDLPRRSLAKAGGSPNRTLAEFGFPKNVYPIGRLDADSEGLLMLSDEPGWNERLLHPRHAHEREYWAQVERIPTPEALRKLARGVSIGAGGRAAAAARGGAAAPPPPGSKGYQTLPCRAWLLEPQPEVGTSRCDVPARAIAGGIVAPLDAARTAQRAVPTLPPRDPPIRFRKSVPDCWIGLELIEGKNRQVRRMTAAIGHPTLRLFRVRIGNFWLGNLAPGQWRILSAAECKSVLSHR